MALNSTSLTADYGQKRDLNCSCVHEMHACLAQFSRGREGPASGRLELKVVKVHALLQAESQPESQARSQARSQAQSQVAWLILQYDSHPHEPHLFARAGSSTDATTQIEGPCTMAQMTIALKAELLHALACLRRASQRMGTATGFYEEEATRAAHTRYVARSKDGQRAVPGTVHWIAFRGVQEGCSNLCLTTQPVHRC